MSVLPIQLDELKRRFPDSHLRPLGDGSSLVEVRDFPLDPSRWTKDRVTVYFIAPNGFPVAKPDCFWVDRDLRLVNGSLPKNSGEQEAPFGGGPKLWFSWHVDPWNANRDSLSSYLRVIASRLQRSE